MRHRKHRGSNGVVEHGREKAALHEASWIAKLAFAFEPDLDPTLICATLEHVPS